MNDSEFVKIEFNGQSNCSRKTDFVIQESLDGKKWHSTNKESELTFLLTTVDGKTAKLIESIAQKTHGG